jgi:hypothetical protein
VSSTQRSLDEIFVHTRSLTSRTAARTRGLPW